MLLDVGLFIPGALAFDRYVNHENAWWVLPLWFGVLSMYWPCFHATTGQTPGKRLLGIRVVRRDGSPIGWGESHRRNAFEYVGAFVTGIAWIAAIRVIPGDVLSASRHHSSLIAASVPSWFLPVNGLFTAWFWGEIVSMLVSKERRTLHDILGGTVVIRTRGEIFS